MTEPENRRRVIVFGLGGTIAMTSTTAGGVAPTLSAEDLVAAVPGLLETGIEVDVVNFRQVPGASLTLADIAALAEAIADHVTATSPDGVVVTQGTDTIEETAYLLDLLHTLPTPVVVTGAMRNPSLAGADGPANLLAAIQTAAHPRTRDQGCLVVFADEIHAARRVRKSHTTSLATFQSPHGGPLGYLVEGTPRLVNRLAHRLIIPARPRGNTRIPILTIALGEDDTMLRMLTSDIIDGLVIAGFGAGHVPADLVAALQSLAATVPVVLASRTGSGSVLHSTYGFPGSERDLLDRGMISAGHLDPYKARILLHALVAADADHATIGRAFGVAGGYHDDESWPWAATSSEEG
ncbi:asparaginase [Nocardia sp. A7]|uniref:asparaginase n=1 Tax=Nocardia sp. A7 TaxID=2789274 RepID=UPI00397C8153